jgi:hypothetical protein
MRFRSRGTFRWALALLSIVLLALLLRQTARAQDGAATGEWSRPLPVSGAIPGSWYPSVAATDDGVLTVIWTSSQNNQDTIYLTQKDGVAWSRPIDVLIGGKHADLRVDGRRMLQLVYADTAKLFASDAPVQGATIAANWNQPFQLNREPATPGDFLVTAEGNLHAVWAEKATADKLAQVIYSQSNDPAASWQEYHVIGENAIENTRVRLARGADGTLYALWRAADRETKTDGIVVSMSSDNGNAWLDTPRALALTDADILQPAIAVDANNALLLIYNFGVKDETFFQLSTDQGVTWNEQKTIPGLYAANPATGNDYFAVAKDSAGNIHLVAVGRQSKDQTAPGVYHLVWDGTRWSAPQELYREGTFIEFPDIQVSNGNQLHIVFSTRGRNQLSGEPDETSQIWYTGATTNAPTETRVPLATFTPHPTATPTPRATVEATRRPTSTRVPLDAPTESPSETVNPFMPIAFALVPVILLLIAVVILVRVLRVRR